MVNRWSVPNEGLRLKACCILGCGLQLLSACAWRAPQRAASTAKPVQGGVSFSDVVLAQTDTKGKLLWKFQAKGVTSGESQVATAKGLKGQLYEAGQPVFDVAAQTSTVRQTNQQVSLQGNVQVTDRQHRAIFRGREVQWNPGSGRLTVRGGLTVTHPQIQLWATELQASKQGQMVQVTGNVVMQTRAQNERQRVQLKANQALWNIKAQSVQAGAVADAQQPTVEIKQLNPTGETALALAGTVQADLKSGIVVLNSPVKLTAGPLALTSRELIWDTVAARISTRELLQIQDPRRQMTVLANRGSLEQRRNLVDLQGSVEVTGLKDRSRLTTDQLLWNTKTERIEAVGNVNYVQASPAFTLRGPRAVGKIESQTLRISGGDVVTEIVP